MPTIIIEGYLFRFYSSDRLEPPHMHVLRDDRAAKVWLTTVTIASNHGFNRSELHRIARLTEEHRKRLLEAWDGYFNS